MLPPQPYWTMWIVRRTKAEPGVWGQVLLQPQPALFRDTEMRISSVYIMKNKIRVGEACLSIRLCWDDSSIPKGGDTRITVFLLLLKLFDRVTENKVTLKNTGKVGFKFKVLTDYQSSPDNLVPGLPLILPLSVSRAVIAGGAPIQTYQLLPRGLPHCTKHSRPGLWVWYLLNWN